LRSRPDLGSWLLALTLRCRRRSSRASAASHIFQLSSLCPEMHQHLLQLLLRALPSIEEYQSSCSEFFSLLERMLTSEALQLAATGAVESGSSSSEWRALLERLSAQIRDHPVVESSFPSVERTANSVPLIVDNALVGLLNLVRALLRRYPSLKKRSLCGQLIKTLFDDCLFSIPKPRAPGIPPPKCKTRPARVACFALLTELCRDCPKNYKLVLSKLQDQLNMALNSPARGSQWQYEGLGAKSATGYVGLQNLGATCYMNSLMQQLFMTKPFRLGLLTARLPDLPEAERGDNILYQVQRMFATLQESAKRFYETSEFTQAVKGYDGEPMNPRVQMDAKEFLDILFDRLEEQLKIANRPGLLQTIFGGEIANQLISKETGRSRERTEPFFTLSVDVKNKKNLLEALQLYITGEQVDAAEDGIGDQLVPHTKRLVISSLPPVLLIHLKRFEYRFDIMDRIKLNSRCEFYESLDLLPYTLEGVARTDAGVPLTSTDPSLPPMRERDYYRFRLVGFVVHTGTINSGHYYSFIRERSPPHRWNQFNDTNVLPFDPRDTAYHAFGGTERVRRMDPDTGKERIVEQERGHSAYILVYERERMDVPLGDLFEDLAGFATTTTAKGHRSANIGGRGGRKAPVSGSDTDTELDRELIATDIFDTLIDTQNDDDDVFECSDSSAMEQTNELPAAATPTSAGDSSMHAAAAVPSPSPSPSSSSSDLLSPEVALPASASSSSSSSSSHKRSKSPRRSKSPGSKSPRRSKSSSSSRSKSPRKRSSSESTTPRTSKKQEEEAEEEEPAASSEPDLASMGVTPASLRQSLVVLPDQEADPNRSPVPANLLKELWAENEAFYKDRYMYNSDYFNFVWSMTSLIKQENFEYFSTKTFDAPQVTVQYLIQMFTHVYTRAKDRPMFSAWVRQIRTLLENDPVSCRWLIGTLCQNPVQLRNVLLFCPDPSIRSAFADILQQAFITLAPFEQDLYQKEHQLLTETKEDEIVVEHHSYIIWILHTLLKMISVHVSRRSISTRHYFRVFRDFAAIGIDERSYLLSQRFVKLFVDFFMEQGEFAPISRLTNTGSSMGSSSYTTTEPPSSGHLDYLLQVIYLLVCTCATDSCDEEHPPPTILEGQVHRLGDLDREALFRSASFFRKILHDDVNTDALVNMACHWSWNSRMHTKFFLNILRADISRAGSRDPSHYLRLLTGLQEMQDDHAYWRLDACLLGVLRVAADKAVSRDLRAHIEGFLASWSESNPEVKKWAQKNSELVQQVHNAIHNNERRVF